MRRVTGNNGATASATSSGNASRSARGRGRSFRTGTTVDASRGSWGEAGRVRRRHNRRRYLVAVRGDDLLDLRSNVAQHVVQAGHSLGNALGQGGGAVTVAVRAPDRPPSCRGRARRLPPHRPSSSTPPGSFCTAGAAGGASCQVRVRSATPGAASNDSGSVPPAPRHHLD